MISGVVLMTLLLPVQIASFSPAKRKFEPFFVVGAFVDCAKILGIPKFRLRDANGNPYLPDRVLLQEPLAQVLSSANVVISEAEVSKRKKYIQTYVKR